MPKQIFQRNAPIKHAKIGKQKNRTSDIPSSNRFLRKAEQQASKKKPGK